MSEDLTPADEGKKEKTRAERRAERKAQKDAQAQAKANDSDEDSGGGLIGWLRDSYNGLFKIVIQPHLPKGRMTLLLVSAFLFGLMWAYAVAPTQFYNGSPHQLNSSDRDNWIRFVAGSYDAGLYDAQTTLNLLNRVENPIGRVNALAQSETGQVQVALQEVQQILPQNPDELPGRDAPSSGNIVASILTFVIAAIVFIVLINIFAIAWGLLIGGYVERFFARFRPESDADRQAKLAVEQFKKNREMEDRMKEQAAASNYGPPVTQKVSTYMKGRQFDDSFAIENEADQFLGECGATVAKTIGESGELAAVEVWLFDKEDFVRTLTKVFVTEHVFNDPVSRSELEAKVENPATDIILAQPGVLGVLETDQIRLESTVADMSYGTGELPPNSYFESLAIQIQAWEKAGSGADAPASTPAAASIPGTAAAPAPAPAFNPPPVQPQQPPTYNPPPQQPQQPPTYNPPPQQPQSPAYNPPPQQPPPGAPQQPSPFAPPPPPGAPNQDDDDPFGGTGDFTPIGN